MEHFSSNQYFNLKLTIEQTFAQCANSKLNFLVVVVRADPEARNQFHEYTMRMLLFLEFLIVESQYQHYKYPY